ncbi:MAG: hypothetical protein JSW07_10010 [bacterium]|nr:MAG: hypothetical protein JSW07_10010 [bacterium]
MKAVAVKFENGFLIPFNKKLEKIKQNRILLEIEIIEQGKIDQGYAILDELVGFCESERTNASVKHDKVIYELELK